MIIDFSPRGYGKTTRALRWLVEREDRILLTFNFSERDRLRAQLQRYKPAAAARIFEWQEWHRQRNKGNHGYAVAIDNADLVLKQIAGERLTYLSINDEDLDTNFYG